MADSDRPLDQLRTMAVVEADEAPGLTHLEAYTLDGLFTVLWHGRHAAEAVVVACGGAMGGLLGPGRGLYPELGSELAAAGAGLLRVGWRRPNDLEACTLDLTAAIDLAWRRGARRFVTVGHSFGGAVAVRAAVAVPAVAGVITFATQSAGCEVADELGDRPLLLFHGDSDELLPLMASEMVRMIAGRGELVVLPGEGHLLRGAHDELRERVLAFVEEVLGAPAE
jgi:fermentation-respiration switch protein FrsA (DUF1100 family)